MFSPLALRDGKAGAATSLSARSKPAALREHDCGRKPSTIAGYRALLESQLLPTFGEMPIESITTPEIEGVDRKRRPLSGNADQGASRHLQQAKKV
jgi:Phage integrase, N-terminal SAM-like domain